jgi:peptide/nickel transport system permease protein
MTGYILRRALVSLPTLLGITLIAFAILNVLPSDPLLTWSDGAAPASAEAMNRLRDALQPDSGPATRYATWLLGLLRLDLGRSLRDGRPVTAVIAEALPWTLLLNLAALAAIYALGLPLGWIGARRRGGAAAAAGRALLLALSVVPPFAAALLLQRLFAVRLGLLPLQGTGTAGDPGVAAAADLLRHLVLPTVCLALAGWAYAARYARAAFRAVLSTEALAAARARGLHGLSLARHFAPNGALPFVWMVAGIVPALVSGSVVIEAIFSWPGLGQVLLRGVEGRDYPLVMALVLLSALTVLMGQLVADLLLPAIDPRLRETVARAEEARG